MKKVLRFLKVLVIFLWRLPRMILGGLVWFYQVTLSPDHGILRHIFPGGYCKFEPSCSEYSKQSIKKHGVIIGVPKAIWRILRCNPWSKGGNDEA